MTGIIFRTGIVQKIQQNQLQLMPDRIAESHGIGNNYPGLNKDYAIVVNNALGSLQFATQFLMARSLHAAPLKTSRDRKAQVSVQLWYQLIPLSSLQWRNGATSS